MVKRQLSKRQLSKKQRLNNNRRKSLRLNKQQGGILAPINNRYNPHLSCDDKPSWNNDDVNQAGAIILRDLKLFLNSDKGYYFSHEVPETYTDVEKRGYLNFYNDPQNLSWLVCQRYLLGLSSIHNNADNKLLRYDGSYFFRWLTHRLTEDERYPGKYHLFVDAAPQAL